MIETRFGIFEPLKARFPFGVRNPLLRIWHWQKEIIEKELQLQYKLIST
jgi:hypothetical protein